MSDILDNIVDLENSYSRISKNSTTHKGLRNSKFSTENLMKNSVVSQYSQIQMQKSRQEPKIKISNIFENRMKIVAFDFEETKPIKRST